MVIDPSPRAYLRILDLHVVPDLDGIPDSAPGPYARIRPNNPTLSDRCLLDEGERIDPRVRADLRLFDDAVSPDLHSVPQNDPALEDDVDLDLHVGPAYQFAADPALVRIPNSHSGPHRLLRAVQENVMLDARNLNVR